MTGCFDAAFSFTNNCAVSWLLKYVAMKLQVRLSTIGIMLRDTELKSVFCFAMHCTLLQSIDVIGANIDNDSYDGDVHCWVSLLNLI